MNRNSFSPTMAVLSLGLMLFIVAGVAYETFVQANAYFQHQRILTAGGELDLLTEQITEVSIKRTKGDQALAMKLDDTAALSLAQQLSRRSKGKIAVLLDGSYIGDITISTGMDTHTILVPMSLSDCFGVAMKVTK